MAVMFRELKGFAWPKEAGRPCEDVFRWERKFGRFALSDGASISYDSRGWALTLCKQFMKNPYVGLDWLDGARKKFAEISTAPADDWAASHASDRGSFATFLGIAITKEDLKVYAIGDTVLFIVDEDNTVKKMWREMSAQDFSVSPALLCSQPDRSAFADTDEAFDESSFYIFAPAGGWAGTRLIAMTDALGEWVACAEGLEDTYSRLNELIEVRDLSSFGAWVSDAIATGKVRRDDCAVLVIGL